MHAHMHLQYHKYGLIGYKRFGSSNDKEENKNVHPLFNNLITNTTEPNYKCFTTKIVFYVTSVLWMCLPNRG